MRRTLLFIFFLLVAEVLVTGIGEAGVKKTIRFSPGSDFATVQESVIRGERDIYCITAKAGQTLEVSISAVEQNAVFSVFQPGTVAEDKDGFTEINGKALPGAGETDDAAKWKGTLPVTGKYLIVVGGTRGNATYKLKVAIRQASH